MDAEQEWIPVGELGVDAATCALWDAAVIPPTFQLRFPAEPPSLPGAHVANVGDDIDGLILVRRLPGDGDVVGVQVDFVDDVAELPAPWTSCGALHLPTGQLVLADPYCSPEVPYRQRLDVRSGTWRVEELHDEGSLQSVRIVWTDPLA